MICHAHFFKISLCGLCALKTNKTLERRHRISQLKMFSSNVARVRVETCVVVQVFVMLITLVKRRGSRDAPGCGAQVRDGGGKIYRSRDPNARRGKPNTGSPMASHTHSGGKEHHELKREKASNTRRLHASRIFVVLHLRKLHQMPGTRNRNENESQKEKTE